MHSQKKMLVRLLGVLTLACFCSPAGAADDAPDVKPDPPTAKAADSPGPSRPREGRNSSARSDNRRPPGPHRSGSDNRYNDPRHAVSPPGRGPGDSASTLRWPLGDAEWLKNNDPEMYQLMESDSNLDRQTRELGLEYGRTPQDKQEAVKRQLQGLVVEQFEARQKRRGLELKRPEEELKRIRDSIEKRNESKQSIVDRRVSELLGEEPQF